MEPISKDFQAFHNYRRLAEAGIVEKLKCSEDGYDLWTQLGAFGELVLLCPGCGRVTVPGQGLIDRIKAEVARYGG